MKNLLRFPLNIQLFNDGGSNGGSTNLTPNPNDGGTEVDVKTSPEYLKLKSQFDSLASQVADYKKKEKASLPELDQLRKDLEEQKKATADAQKEILHSKITAKFIGAGFDEKTTEGFIKAFTDSENPLNFIDTIINGINARIEKVKADAKAEFQSSQTVPGGNGNPNNNKTNVDDLLKYKPSYGGKTPLDLIKK